MKFEAKKITQGHGKGKWGVFLEQEFCKTDEPVCYCVSANQSSAEVAAGRLSEDVEFEEE